RQRPAARPSAEQEAPFGSAGIGRALGIGMLGKSCFEVIFMDGSKVAYHLGAIQDLANSAHSSHPRTQHTVRKATIAVLVLGALLFEQCNGLGRIIAHHAL